MRGKSDNSLLQKRRLKEASKEELQGEVEKVKEIIRDTFGSSLGYCPETALALSYLLTKKGINHQINSGEVGQTFDEYRGHCWVESSGFILDPSINQFSDEKELGEFLKEVCVLNPAFKNDKKMRSPIHLQDKWSGNYALPEKIRSYGELEYFIQSHPLNETDKYYEEMREHGREMLLRKLRRI